MNYARVKCELLIAARGDRSQLEMSRRLGFAFNQYNKWERETKWLRWSELIDILDVVSVPYRQVFEELFNLHEDPRKMKTLLQVICGNLSIAEIAQKTHHSEDVVRRWIRGDVSPNVETVFLLMQERTNNLAEFVGRLVEIEKVPSLHATLTELHAHKYVEVRYPFASAIEACLLLRDYIELPEHSDAWIARRVMVSESLVTEALDALLRAGVVAKVGLKYVLLKWTQLNGLPLEDAAKVDRYWTQRALDRYAGSTGVPWTPTDHENTNARAFRVAPVSDQAARAIRDVVRKASQDILGIILSDPGPATKVKVFLYHYFDVQDIHWQTTDSLTPPESTAKD